MAKKGIPVDVVRLGELLDDVKQKYLPRSLLVIDLGSVFNVKAPGPPPQKPARADPGNYCGHPI